MKMESLLIHLTPDIKRKLGTLRREGYTASGFIRAVLERELANMPDIPTPEPRTRATQSSRKGGEG